MFMAKRNRNQTKPLRNRNQTEQMISFVLLDFASTSFGTAEFLLAKYILTFCCFAGYFEPFQLKATLLHKSEKQMNLE